MIRPIRLIRPLFAALLLLAGHFALVTSCAAQPTTAPSAAALTVNTTTGAITAPTTVSPSLFRSANGLAAAADVTAAVNGLAADPSTNGSFSPSAWRIDLALDYATRAQTRALADNASTVTPARLGQSQRLRASFYGPRPVATVAPVLAAPSLTSGITGGVGFSRTSAAVRVYRGKVAIAGGSYPSDQFVRADYVTTNNESSAIAFEFGFDGTEFAFLTLDNSARYRVFVDGKIAVGGVNLGSTGNLYYIKFTFPSRAQRIVTIEGCNNFFWGGGVIGPNDTLYLPPASPQTKVLVIGDSFPEGTGAGASALGSFSHLIGEMMNWDVWSSGSGSTGWATAGSNQQNFLGRLAADVIANNPRSVWFTGGINDEGWVTANGEAAYTAQVQATLNALIAGLPDLDEIVIVGPWWPSSAAVGVRDTIRGVLATQAAAYGAIYIEPKGWFTGTGRVGSTTGSGNADYYTSSDGVHPSTAGHIFIARRCIEDYLRAKGALADARNFYRAENITTVLNYSAAPESAVSATIGTLAARTDNGLVYAKVSGTGNTGWKQLTDVDYVQPVATGGTGQSTYTNGQLLIGNTTGNTLAKATLTAGPGIGVTNGAGTITLSADINSTSRIDALAASDGTNDAAAGKPGEYFSDTLAVGSAITLTTSTGANIVSRSLTAGDWEVTGNINLNSFLVANYTYSGGITTTSATPPTDGSESVATFIRGTLKVTRRIKVTSTTAVYLAVMPGDLSMTTATAWGSMQCRRAR